MRAASAIRLPLFSVLGSITYGEPEGACPQYNAQSREVNRKSLAFGSPTGSRFGVIFLLSQLLLLDRNGGVLPFCGVPLHVPRCHSQRPGVAFAFALFFAFSAQRSRVRPQDLRNNTKPKKHAPFRASGHLANSLSQTRIIDIEDRSTRRTTGTTAP